MIAAEKGEISRPLQQYLRPGAEKDRIDLYSDAGQVCIVDMLQPKRQNLGRWDSDPSHSMSLMQQFAINAAFETLETEGLYSVNGPPGTGKTTLLRDMIAENITKRAGILAQLDNSWDAFIGKKKAGKTSTINYLKSELTGFEMVVASSNNAAVENLSKDLPKKSSIWNANDFEYLQPIAHSLALETAERPQGENEKRGGGEKACEA